jgi:hypothetical protein
MKNGSLVLNPNLPMNVSPPNITSGSPAGRALNILWKPVSIV